MYVMSIYVFIISFGVFGNKVGIPYTSFSNKNPKHHQVKHFLVVETDLCTARHIKDLVVQQLRVH